MRRGNRLSVLGGIAGSLLLLGCGEGPVKPAFVEEITVFGYLYAGEYVTDANAIRLGRTRPVGKPYDEQEAAVRDAVVTLWAGEAVPAAPDTLKMIAPGLYANPRVWIRPETRYHLAATVDGRQVTAVTTTPVPFQVIRSPGSVWGEAPRTGVADPSPLVVACRDPEQIFLVDVYCREDWHGARYIDPILPGRDTPRDYVEYGGATGPPRHLWAYFRLRDAEVSDLGYVLSFYRDMMIFYGNYDLGVYTIDRNYYEYLYRENPERNGGVTGGIGVFGSAYRRTYRVMVLG